MMEFTDYPIVPEAYSGANGKKVAVNIGGTVYMVKLPTHARFNDDMSYANSALAEHIGSRIFASVGIPSQETMIGTYQAGGMRYLAVACRDFTYPDLRLYDFASVKNSVVDSASGGRNTELDELLLAMEGQRLVDPEDLKRWFWDVFIVDALINNPDRHNGNWGFLHNRATNETVLAPVFDCGSALYPQADPGMISRVAADRGELEERLYGSRSTSAIHQNGKRINYHDFLLNCDNDDCRDALLRVFPRIDMSSIEKIIVETPAIEPAYRDYLILMMHLRRNEVLGASYEAVCLERGMLVEHDPRGIGAAGKVAELKKSLANRAVASDDGAKAKPLDEQSRLP